MNYYLFNRKATVEIFYRFDGPRLEDKKLGMACLPERNNLFSVWMLKINNRGWTLETNQLTGNNTKMFLSHGNWKIHYLTKHDLEVLLSKRRQELEMYLENI